MCVTYCVDLIDVCVDEWEIGVGVSDQPSHLEQELPKSVWSVVSCTKVNAYGELLTSVTHSKLRLMVALNDR